MQNKANKIVVAGGGFAGMNFAKALANHNSFEVTLVDIDNYHSFSPLLYQVAMAFIEPEQGKTRLQLVVVVCNERSYAAVGDQA